VTDATDSKPRIDIEPGVYCELFVRDNGNGLDAATKDRMFDPFFTSKPNHRGLGLSAVMGIAKSHRAHIDVQSEPEQGTTVRVLFPAAARQRLATSRATSRPAGSARVLVVDDEPLVLEMIRMVLQSRGYRVDAFAAPEDALQFYRREQGAFDVAVLDLSMPLYSGLEMASALRLSKPGLPIVFTSGFGRPASLGSSDVAKGTAFVDKPFQSRELVAKIQEVLASNEREASLGEATS
jgi:CheY-like chemotaxis protein